MNARIWMLLAVAVGLLASAAGCATTGNSLVREADAIKSVADEARVKMDAVEEGGGPRCGIRELAVADAQYKFAQVEIKEGRYRFVRKHLKEARTAAEAALLKSHACEPLDSDHDGIPDAIDKCPFDPEDYDGFEDSDGCPDPDNDHDGIPDAEDKCPNDPEDYDGFQDEDGCPDPDNDQDGIPDVVDKCPNEPEDFDGFEDSDGCPDPDNDHDGIPDAVDKCPNEPETFNGYQDDDGCPDTPPYTLIEITDKAIEIKQMVFFATGKDVILPKSFPLLNEVAKALRDNPAFVIEVGGHTDNRGNKKLNDTLSQKRADSVRRYLVEKGQIDGTRLTAKGYGDSQPIATNQTQVGRDKNRRVEFKIVSR